MNTILAPGSFILIIIGTLGLLANEFIFDWGSSATVTFAVFNLVGLAALVLSYRSTKQA
ncbi:hypothetical protein ACFLVB_03800 [Chloroflexota bacterium]